MATATATVVCDNSTLANFKSWAQAISSAFSTLGWTQTADTGQVNWSTIASVPSSTYVYEIWEAADSASSTTPIFVKFEYGFSSASVAFRVTVGSGSNGSGTITGSVIGPWATTGLANQGATTFNCYFSGDAGTFRLMMWQTFTLGCTVFGIERSRDTSGAETTDYVTALMAAANSTGGAWHQQTMVSGSPTVCPAGGAINSSNGSVATAFATATGKVAAFPVIPIVGYPGNQMLGFVAAVAADVNESNGTPATVNIYGSNHSYLFSKQGDLTLWGEVNPNGVGGAAGMLYE
jgi:hypothetical protein